MTFFFLYIFHNVFNWCSNQNWPIFVSHTHNLHITHNWLMVLNGEECLISLWSITAQILKSLTLKMHPNYRKILIRILYCIGRAIRRWKSMKKKKYEFKSWIIAHKIQCPYFDYCTFGQSVFGHWMDLTADGTFKHSDRWGNYYLLIKWPLAISHPYIIICELCNREHESDRLFHSFVCFFSFLKH